jgi:hypothetical protein
MTSIIYSIPEIIFTLIQNYLSNIDKHYFFNSSKYLFIDLKKRMIYFQLNKVKSQQYLQDKLFQSLLLSKVENGWNQIGIKYFGSRCPEEIPPIHNFYAEGRTVPFHLWNKYHSYAATLPADVEELPDLTNVKELQLTFDDDLQTVDLSKLSHLNKLSLGQVNDMDMTPLQYIPDVTILSGLVYDGGNTNHDFSMFHRQKRLELWDCRNLTNINSFHSIRILHLFRCPNLQKDLSPLKGIYDLALEL